MSQQTSHGPNSYRSPSPEDDTMATTTVLNKPYQVMPPSISVAFSPPPSSHPPYSRQHHPKLRPEQPLDERQQGNVQRQAHQQHPEPHISLGTDPLLIPWTQPRSLVPTLDRFITDEHATPSLFTHGANLEPAQTAHIAPDVGPAWSAHSQSQSASGYAWGTNDFLPAAYAPSQSSSHDDDRSHGYVEENAYDSYGADPNSLRYPRLGGNEDLQFRGLGGGFVAMSEVAGRQPEEVTGSGGDDDELELDARDRNLDTDIVSEDLDHVNALVTSNDYPRTLPSLRPIPFHRRSISDPQIPTATASSKASSISSLERTKSTMSSRRHKPNYTNNNIRPQNPPRKRRGGHQATRFLPHRRPTSNPRQFLCTFLFAGCTAQFSSKNEWKRHVSTQHMQLTIWRCDHSSCVDRRKSVFNRKDLFGQHLRRLHCPKFSDCSSADLTRKEKEWVANEVPKIQERCRIDQRPAPETSTCGFCGKLFSGRNAWEQRMEHVGQHYEDGPEDVSKDSWNMDFELVNWALNQRLVRKRIPGERRKNDRNDENANEEEFEYELIQIGKELCVESGRVSSLA